MQRVLRHHRVSKKKLLDFIDRYTMLAALVEIALVPIEVIEVERHPPAFYSAATLIGSP